MVTRIDGKAPGLGLNIMNYSGKMNCLSWCTIDPRDLTMDGERIIAIAPRAGALPLVAPEFSSGPKLGDVAGYPAALHERDVLDYLVAHTRLDGSTFSLAAVCDIDAKLNSPQNIFSLSSNKKHIRLLRQADSFVAKMMGQDVFVSEKEWSGTGPVLAIMSASNGVLRVRISDASRIGDISESPFENPNTKDCNAIFGAEQVGEAADAPTPSAPRSWRGHMLEMLIFEHDILASSDDLTLLDQYFAEIYAGV